MKGKIELSIELPEKMEARKEGEFLVIKGPKGENKRNIANPILNFEFKNKEILISTRRINKNDKKLAYTYRAHIKNMIKGVSEGYKYVLKICASHFPMNVSVNKNQLIIKNFLGEKYPRRLELKEGVRVKVEGDQIFVESVDKELAGTVASDIERLTKRAKFDPRIFQDGCYIMMKDGKEK